jgi:hypothetical protein
MRTKKEEEEEGGCGTGQAENVEVGQLTQLRGGAIAHVAAGQVETLQPCERR